jgi:hypothetical protein
LRQRGEELLASIGLPFDDPADFVSPHRFADGGRFRFEIPSVEGPETLAVILDEVRRVGVPLHRVSQGSGIELLTDAEVREMAVMGRQAGIEVSLFLTPRALFDIGAMHLAPGGAGVRNRIRGMRQLAYALDELARAYALGIRSFLVTDPGLLATIGELRVGGRLPGDVRVKLSVMIGEANGASARVLERLGATTFNIPTDLSIEQMASIRQACRMPLDVYVESPDDVGGFVRYHEMPRIVDAASPVYLKFGLRNAPGIYPSGRHLVDVAASTARERVHRLAIAWEALARVGLADQMSPLPVTVGDLAVPVPA